MSGFEVGDKVAARRVAEGQGIPVLPGFVSESQDDSQVLAWAGTASYPLMVTSLGSGETVIVAASTGEDYCDVRWSPDGRYLSATVHPGGPGDFDNVMVGVVEVATGEQTVVGAGSNAEWRP